MIADVKDLVERLRAMNLAQCDDAASALEAQAKEIERLVDENDELRQQPWPWWASKVLSVIRSRSGYDGYDDAIDGVDLPAELEETMTELERQVEMLKRTGDANLRQWGEAHQRAEAAERERDALKLNVRQLEEFIGRREDDILSIARERDALRAKNEQMREALEHVTELVVDSWASACDGDPEHEVAVRDARAALHPTPEGER